MPSLSEEQLRERIEDILGVSHVNKPSTQEVSELLALFKEYAVKERLDELEMLADYTDEMVDNPPIVFYRANRLKALQQPNNEG